MIDGLRRMEKGRCGCFAHLSRGEMLLQGGESRSSRFSELLLGKSTSFFYGWTISRIGWLAIDCSVV